MAPVFWFVAVVLASVQIFFGFDMMITMFAFGAWGMGFVCLVRDVRKSTFEEK